MLADRLRQNQTDNSPNVLGLINVTSAEKSTVVTSNTVAISGLAGPTAILISGGEYSQNAGAYTSADGTVTNADTLTLRHTSSSSYLTATTTTVQVGLSVSTWSSTTRAQDTTPNVFSFTSVSGVERSTVQTSNLITVSGIDTDVTLAVSISGGSYSKNGAAYTTAAGTAVNGDTFRVQHTSSGSFTTPIETILTIGSQSASYTSTTRALDTTPNAFSFTAVTGATPSTLYTSNLITLSGMGSGDVASVGIVGGTYSHNGAAYTTASSAAINGDTFRVQVASSSSFSTAATATLTIGGVSGSYQVTTRAADTTPSAFSFTSVTGATPSATYLSGSITVAGLDTGVSTGVSVSGGSYSKNGGALTTASGTAVNGDLFQVTRTASASYSTLLWSTLTIGGVSANFEVTTVAADTTPSAFSFTDLTDQACNAEIASSSITVAGLSSGVSTTLSLSGASSYWRKNGGSWNSAGTGGTVVNGDTVQLRLFTDNRLNQTWSCTLTIGGVADTWSVVTGNDQAATAWDWINYTNVTASAEYMSDIYTVSGLTPGYRATVACAGNADLVPGFKINGGATIYAPTTSTAANGDTVRAVIKAPATAATAGGITVSVGSTLETWYVTTAV
jgi:hypothetical protein